MSLFAQKQLKVSITNCQSASIVSSDQQTSDCHDQNCGSATKERCKKEEKLFLACTCAAYGRAESQSVCLLVQLIQQ